MHANTPGLVTQEPGWVGRLFTQEVFDCQYQELKFVLHRKLLDRINLELLSSVSSDRVRSEVRAAVSKLVDARLPDGSRVNAAIPPVAVDGPLLSIRRFGRERLKAHDLVKNLTMTDGMLTLLEACVRARLNIVVSGGTGAGKTTLLNAL